MTGKEVSVWGVLCFSTSEKIRCKIDKGEQEWVLSWDISVY